MRIHTRAAAPILAAVGVGVASLALVAPAAAATTYRLAGVETAATSSTGTFAGLLLNVPGTWQATIVHGELNKTQGGVTPILAGSFALAPFGAPATGGAVTGGQVVARAPSGPLFCTQRFLVGGTLQGVTGSGAFQGTLTHYGLRSGGVCNAQFATFAGSVSLP